MHRDIMPVGADVSRLANKKESNKKLVRVLKKNVTTDDRLGPEVVSPGNKGFASVIGLAALIAVAGVIIAFITLKY